MLNSANSMTHGVVLREAMTVIGNNRGKVV